MEGTLTEISIKQNHTRGLDEAKNRVTTLLNELVKDESVSAIDLQWFGDKKMIFKFDYKAIVQTFTITGSIEISESMVIIDATLPVRAAHYKGRIEDRIRSKLLEILA